MSNNKKDLSNKNGLKNRKQKYNKNDKTKGNSLIWKFAGIGFATLIIGGGIGVGVAKYSFDHNIHGNIITAKINNKEYHLSARKGFNYLIESSNNQQALLNLALNQVLIKKYSHNNYMKEAKQKLNKVIQQVGGQDSFNNYMAQRNTNENQYLMSMANIMIIKDQLQKNYKPTESEIKNAYNEMGNKYNLSAIAITPQNANDKKSILAANEIAKKLNNKKFDAQAALKKKSNQYLITNLTNNKEGKLFNINGNNNANLPSGILNQLKNKKAGDIIINNSPYSHYIVKIDKVINKGSLAQEKDNIIKQLKQSASADNNKQLHFSAQILKETGFKSNSKDIQAMINLTKQK